MTEREHWIGALGIVLAVGCNGEVVPSGGKAATGQTPPADTSSGNQPPTFGPPVSPDAGTAGALEPSGSDPSPPPPSGADAGAIFGTMAVEGDAGDQPVIVVGGTPPTTQAPPPSQAYLVTLAAGQICPWEMAIDALSVYWTDCGDPTGGYVLSVPKTGGAIVTIATGDRLSGIAVGGSNVYWVASNADASSGAIMTASVGGGTATIVAPQSGEPSHLAVDGLYAYWGESLAGGVMRAPLVGGAATLVSSATEPFQIALWDDSVYWIGPQGLMTAAKTGGLPITLALLGPPLPTAGLAVNGTAVYFSAGPPLGTPGIDDVTIDGGPVSAVAAPPSASGASGGGPVALDDARVYWADMSGAIYAAPLAGGTATLLATGQVNVASIAVDETAVYWLVNGNGSPGGVVKLPLAAVDWP